MTVTYDQIEKATKINDELMEHLDATIRRLLHYCKKNGIEPPNIKQLQASIRKAHVYLNELPTKPNNRENQPDSEHNHFHGKLAPRRQKGANC